MKASELITELKLAINEHGDQDVSVKAYAGLDGQRVPVWLTYPRVICVSASEAGPVIRCDVPKEGK